MLARELARTIQQPPIATADGRGHGTPQDAPSPWPGWIQRCGIGSSCGCEPQDKLAGVHRDLHRATTGAGARLPDATRARMESALGSDFSAVTVHTGAAADDLASRLDAHALTVGTNILFRSGAYRPGTPGGDRLLAHELTHVVQQARGPIPSLQRQLTIGAPHDRYEQEADRVAEQVTRVPGPGWLQRQPMSGKDAPGAMACPPMEDGEREEAAKAPLRMEERIPQQEWLIHGFPIGGSDISGADAGRFIEDIVNSLMRGHWVYATGQDPVEVLGFSDCFAGPHVDNHLLRQLRAANFCAKVKDHYASTPKSYTNLIRSCDAAPANQYVGSNATREDRARNRSILVRRLAATVPEEYQGFPFDPGYGPSEAHCALYSSGIARDILGPVYTSNAHCSCLVPPDEPHNNCVRHCLQDKFSTMLANLYRDRKPGDPPVDINFVCPTIWRHHRECYHDCGCASEFIDYLAFHAVCNIGLPCAVDSAAINLLNRCMPATKSDKYLPVP